MATITPVQARNYLDRWKLVREVEIKELRSASMDIKARQLAVLMASRHLFTQDLRREKEVADIRERWARIRGTASD